MAGGASRGGVRRCFSKVLLLKSLGGTLGGTLAGVSSGGVANDLLVRFCY